MEFRYARHTQKIESLVYFYTSILNFEILGKFENHDGYDGVFLGLKRQNWHLEFTQNAEKPLSKFDENDALVFYPETKEEFDKILQNVKKFKIPIFQLKNPYWRENGVCFEDCDHYKIIISKLKIRK